MAPSQFAGIASLDDELVIPSGVREQSAASQQGEETGRGRDSPAHRDLLQPDPGLCYCGLGRTTLGTAAEEKKGRREAKVWIASGWASG